MRPSRRSNRATSDSVANEELSCVSLTAGVPYFVWADEGSLGTAGVPFELEVNGCVAEVEPNNTPATASPLYSAGITFFMPGLALTKKQPMIEAMIDTPPSTSG